MATDGKRWGWQNSLRTLRREIKNALDAPDGIDVLIDEMDDDLRRDYLRTLVDIRTRIDRIVPVLESRVISHSHAEQSES